MFRQLTAPLGTFDYTIKPGDTLYGIARMFNSTVENLVKFNYFVNPNLIAVGRTIIIPLSPPEAIIYTVLPGDTLYKISRKFTANLQALIDFNYLVPPYIIFPGQRLVVAASLR